MGDAWALLDIANTEIAKLKEEIDERDRDYEQVQTQLAETEIHTAFYHGYHGLRYNAHTPATTNALEAGVRASERVAASESAAVSALRTQLADAQADTRRLDWLDKWLRWSVENRREIWSEAAGFQLVDSPRTPIGNPYYKLRDAIDATMLRPRGSE